MTESLRQPPARDDIHPADRAPLYREHWFRIAEILGRKGRVSDSDIKKLDEAWNLNPEPNAKP